MNLINYNYNSYINIRVRILIIINSLFPNDFIYLPFGIEMTQGSDSIVNGPKMKFVIRDVA